MATTITGFGNQLLVRGSERAPKSEATPGSPPSKAVSDTDEVQLTAGSQTLRQMQTDPGQPVDGAKVAALKQAIEEGRYKIDPRRIAEKMFGFETALSG